MNGLEKHGKTLVSISKMYDTDRIKQAVRAYGSVSQIRGRHSGHSTGCAMKSIGKLMSGEVKCLKFRRGDKADFHHLRMIESLIRKLGLMHFSMKEENMVISLSYDIWYKEEELKDILDEYSNETVSSPWRVL